MHFKTLGYCSFYFLQRSLLKASEIDDGNQKNNATNHEISLWKRLICIGASPLIHMEMVPQGSM